LENAIAQDCWIRDADHGAKSCGSYDSPFHPGLHLMTHYFLWDLGYCSLVEVFELLVGFIHILGTCILPFT
jgi:hypothetical protein